jgi:hypothetical protein
MKKLLLLCIGASVSYMAGAQNTVNPTRSVGYKTESVASDVQHAGSPTMPSSKKVRQTLAAFPSSLGKKEVVGRTTYDLQTNGSTQRRVQQSGNTISCGWTFSAEQNVTSTSAFADRGTGYAHFNGTSWSAEPTARLESVRTGFGGFAGNGGTTERYIAHDAAGNNLHMAVKTGGTWTNAPLTTSTTSQSIWPHSAASGNWLYVIASPADSNIHSNGIRNGYFFSRSNDNGATWIDNMIPLPLVDSVGHYRGGGNSYAIAANGNNVAIICGDMGADLTLIKSTDNGATWTKTVIWNWPLDNFDFASTKTTDYNNDAVVDTLWTNDGSHTMTMGSNGKVHVSFPVVRVYKDGSTTGYNFFYSTLLAYWNEDMAVVADSVMVVDNIFLTYHDCDKDGSFGLGQNYTGSATTDPDGIYNTIGLITMPSITVTNSTPEKVLIAYTAIMDNDTTVDDFNHTFWLGASSLEGQNYRDVFVVGTQDAGANWTYPVNISRTAHFEETYPSVAENVSGNTLAVLYQGDIEPGTILQNNDIYDPNFQNMMICHTVGIDSIFIVGADSTAPCGQFELPFAVNTISAQEGTIEVYPNPATDVITINMNLVNASKSVVYEIADVTGKIVYTQTASNVKSDLNKINISNLATGAYLLKVTADSGIYTEKLIKH